MATKKKAAPLDIAEYAVPKTLVSAIKNEVTKRNSDLQMVIDSQKSEIIGLRAQLSAITGSKVIPNDMSATQQIFSKADPQTLVSMLSAVIPSTFHYDFERTSYSSDKIPVEFQCHVNFYKDRFLVYQFLDEIGIKYHEWTKQVVLPHEWNREYLSLFLDNLRNQYVCNGCIFEKNLHFWYKEHREKLVDPALQIKHNYSEIPWQFILSNPAWADDDLVERISSHFHKSDYGSHIGYFLRLPNYNKNMKPEHYVTIMQSMKEDEHFKKFFEHEAVKSAVFKSGDNGLKDRVLKLIEVREEFPATYQEDYINQMSFDKAMQYIHRSKIFSETEKAALASNVMKKQYSKEAILERVLSN